MSAHEVKFHAIRKHGTLGARVHAAVDGAFVLWDPAGPDGGWVCKGCDPEGIGLDLAECPHIEAIETLLAPSVLGEWDPH
jgi:hypothetical protein